MLSADSKTSEYDQLLYLCLLISNNVTFFTSHIMGTLEEKGLRGTFIVIAGSRGKECFVGLHTIPYYGYSHTKYSHIKVYF